MENESTRLRTRPVCERASVWLLSGVGVLFEIVTVRADLANGGIAVVPMHVGYAMVGATSKAIRRVFEAKRRQPAKLNAITGSPELHRELHIADERARGLVQNADWRAVAVERDLAGIERVLSAQRSA